MHPTAPGLLFGVHQGDTITLVIASGHIVITAVLLGAVAGGAAGAEPPVEQWGQPRAGLQLSLTAVGQPALGAKLPVRLAVRNTGTSTVQFSETEPALAWFTVVRSRDEAWLTEKVSLKAVAPNWPARIVGGKGAAVKAFDLAARHVYPYAHSREILKNYLGIKDAKPLPATVGTLGRNLRSGAMVLRCRIVLPRPDDKPLILTSNKFTVDVAPPDLAALAEAERKAYVARLLKRFDRDPWSGQAAHDICVRMGTSVVPYLAEAAFERNRPGHARLWIAAAIADIPCPTSVETMIKLLGERHAGVRHVVAYHGPKQRNAKLDKAILARTLERKDPRMTGLAVVGFLAHQGKVHDSLLAASLDSNDPRVRTVAAEALSQHASVQNVLRITALLKDKHERVRGAAATTLAAMGSKNAKTVHTHRVVGALVQALEAPGETARHRICAALSALSGRNMPYDTNAPEADREKILDAWRQWWKETKHK